MGSSKEGSMKMSDNSRRFTKMLHLILPSRDKWDGVTFAKIV